MKNEFWMWISFEQIEGIRRINIVKTVFKPWKQNVQLLLEMYLACDHQLRQGLIASIQLKQFIIHFIRAGTEMHIPIVKKSCQGLGVRLITLGNTYTTVLSMLGRQEWTDFTLGIMLILEVALQGTMVDACGLKDEDG